MKIHLLGSTLMLSLGFAQAAMAADLPLKAPPPPVCIWCGFYIGANVGAGFATDQRFISYETDAGAPFVSGTWPGFGNFGSLPQTGAFGGGQFGYNWQAGLFVIGFETDIEGSGIQGIQGPNQDVTLAYIGGGNTVTEGLTRKLDFFGTARGRVGIAFDRILLYGTGGFAYGGIRDTYTYVDTFGFSGASATSTTLTGYAAGAGLEYAFAPNWTAKFEYQFIDLGRTTLALTEFIAGVPTPFADHTTINNQYHTARVGLNYKFDWGPSGPIMPIR
jgi:outer membrane immunogenic protein